KSTAIATTKLFGTSSAGARAPTTAVNLERGRLRRAFSRELRRALGILEAELTDAWSSASVYTTREPFKVSVSDTRPKDSQLDSASPVTCATFPMEESSWLREATPARLTDS